MYGDVFCCNINWKYWPFIFITLFRPGICVQSGTKQAYVLALGVGIEKDNVNKYLRHVIVSEHWFGLSSQILIRVNSNAFKLVIFCLNSKWWWLVSHWNFKPVLSIMGDYRYTELSCKLTSLISRTCCLGSSGLTYT